MSHVQKLKSERFLFIDFGELPWYAETTKSPKLNVLFSTQARKPSEVFSFPQCNMKLSYNREVLVPTQPSVEQMVMAGRVAKCHRSQGYI